MEMEKYTVLHKCIFFCIFGPGNGSPMATNVFILVLVVVLGVLVIFRFSIP